MSDENRYEGRPFLRFLELYVLWAIRKLPADQESMLVAMEPSLRKIYGHSDRWHEIIAAQMAFPLSFPELVRDVWERNRIGASEAGSELTPDEFALKFVDVNFPS